MKKGRLVALECVCISSGLVVRFEYRSGFIHGLSITFSTLRMRGSIL